MIKVDIATSPIQAPGKHLLPELEILCYLLVLLFLIDQERYNEAKACSSATIVMSLQVTLLKFEGILDVEEISCMMGGVEKGTKNLLPGNQEDVQRLTESISSLRL